MISFEVFDKRLDIFKDGFKKIKTEFNYLAEGLSHIIEDNGGVPHTWIYRLAEFQFQNLCLAVNENLSETVLNDLVDYYIWESDFKGKVEWTEEEKNYVFDLSDNKQLYECIKGLR